MAYCEETDVTDWLALAAKQDPADIANRRALFTRLIEASGAMIDSCTNRSFENVSSEERTFYPENRPVLLEIGDVQTISSVTEDSGTLDTDGYRLQPSPVVGRPPRFLQRLESSGWLSPVAVTATWGWATVPDAIKQACIMLTARLYQRSKSPLGTATYGEGAGDYYVRTNDPDIYMLLQAYKLHAVA